MWSFTSSHIWKAVSQRSRLSFLLGKQWSDTCGYLPCCSGTHNSVCQSFSLNCTVKLVQFCHTFYIEQSSRASSPDVMSRSVLFPEVLHANGLLFRLLRGRNCCKLQNVHVHVYGILLVCRYKVLINTCTCTCNSTGPV